MASVSEYDYDTDSDLDDDEEFDLEPPSQSPTERDDTKYQVVIIPNFAYRRYVQIMSRAKFNLTCVVRHEASRLAYFGCIPTRSRLCPSAPKAQANGSKSCTDCKP